MRCSVRSDGLKISGDPLDKAKPFPGEPQKTSLLVDFPRQRPKNLPIATEYYPLLFPLNERQQGFFERLLPDGGRVTFFREYDREALPGRLLFKTRLVTPVGEHQAAWPLLPLRREEVTRCVDDAGLGGIQVLGDYDCSPFSGTSPALIVVGGQKLPPPG